MWMKGWSIKVEIRPPFFTNENDWSFGADSAVGPLPDACLAVVGMRAAVPVLCRTDFVEAGFPVGYSEAQIL